MTRSLELWLEDTWNDAAALRLRLRSTLHSEITHIQRIDVHDSHALGRILCLGGRIAFSQADAALYSEGLAHPAMQAHPQATSVAILGGGDGGVAREVCRYAHLESVTVVEIDQRVCDVAQTYFPELAAGLNDPRVRLIHDDAHRWLQTNDNQFDIILIDADELYDASSDPIHRTRFDNAIASHLAEDGVLIAPLGEPTNDAAACRAHLGALQDRFPQVHVYRVNSPSLAGQPWLVAWCSRTRKPTVTADADAMADQLEWWSPAIQAGQFALPRHLRRSLGL